MNEPEPAGATVVTPQRAAWFLALFLGATPLWAGQNLPMVDLPQHLHLISVLHRLSDASTLYPEFFAQRPVLTPYLGYYYLVSGLNWLLPLDLANRVFLTAYVAGLPLSLAFLLASLKRPTWPALLALPFAYGDSFAWGFVNYISALPLAFLTCGFLVRAIEDAPRRRRWAVALGASLVAVLLFHVQVFAWLGVALPLLSLMTPAPEGKKAWRARLPAIYGVLPGVLLFILWVGLRVGQPQEVAPGQPWKSWGPMLSEQNLGWKPFAQNLQDLIAVPRDAEGSLEWRHSHFPTLAGVLPDGGDDLAVMLALLAAAASVVLALWQGWRAEVGPHRTLQASLGAAWKSPSARRWLLLLTALTLAPILLLVLRGSVESALVRLADGMADPHFNPLAVAQLVVGIGVAVPGTAAGVLTAYLLGARWPSFRLIGLAALALLLFFALPFDIRGYMYYLNTRYAHLFAALLVGCVPPLKKEWAERAVWVGAALALVTALPLFRGFKAFDAEAQAVRSLSDAAGDKPKVFGMVVGSGSMSRAVTHPMFLHASCLLARERGGLTNFSFAVTPHSPLMYRAEPPPTPPSEWRPQELQWETQGRFYDHFLVRGAHPSQVFGAKLGSELYLAAERDGAFLVRKR